MCRSDLYTQHYYYPFIVLFYWLHGCRTTSLAVLGLALLSARRCLEGDCPPSLLEIQYKYAPILACLLVREECRDRTD
jgi:hypothetical protein